MTTGTFDIGGEGGNSFTFDAIGDAVTGQILNLEEVQQTDMATGAPSFWEGGQPKMMYRVTLQTQLRDPQDPSDDGRRAVYLRGSRKPDSGSSLSAVVAAVRAATGGTQLATGATLTLTYVADGVAPQRGFNAPKHYQAQYVPPAMEIGDQAPQQPAAQAPAAPPPAQQPAAPAAATQPPATTPAPASTPPASGGMTPEQQAALAAIGITPEQLAALAAANQGQPAA